MTQKVSRIAYMSLALSGLLLVGAGCASQTKLGMQANTETKEDGGVADEGSSDKNDAKEKVDANVNASAGMKVNTANAVSGKAEVKVAADASATAGTIIGEQKKKVR